MIQANQLKMRYGPKILFEDADFQLTPRNRYGLVGPNGSGKSTLLKILASEVTPDAGDISLPSRLTIGTLKQDHFIYENIPILHVVMMGNLQLWNCLEKKRKLLEDEEFSDQDCHLLEELEHIIEKEGGYHAESRASTVLEGLGIPSHQHFNPLRTLSGGYKLRVLLAQVLFSEPELLLLDEPTNHLDLFSIKWLEEYLQGYQGTLIISSHDREFLNKVSTHIIDIDHETITIYPGNYDAFLETKANLLEQNQHLLDKQAKKKEHLQEFVDRFRAKATKARQAQSKLRFAEKLQEEMESLLIKPTSRKHPKLRFDIDKQSGIRALRVSNLCKSYGEKKVLHQISFEIERGHHVAFLGANGIGKSTLLEILTNSIKFDEGNFEWGIGTKVAYFPQDHHRFVTKGVNLLDWLGQCDPLAPQQTLREILARSLFSGDEVEKTMEVLSGGELARLILAKLMLEKHNVLIFDEPTNHLDMESTESLIQAMGNYPGTILVVSHNRYFVSKVAKRIIEMSEKGIIDYQGTFQEYLATREVDLLAPTKEKKKDVDSPALKNDYLEAKQQRNFKNQIEKKITVIEKKCGELEEKIQKINDLLSTENFYTSSTDIEIQDKVQQKHKLELELEAAFSEWEKLHQSIS